MRVNYNITEEGKIAISFFPEEDITDGLRIHYDDLQPVDEIVGHQPVIMHDLYKGVTEYELPPNFDVTKIKEVHIEKEVPKYDAVKKF